MSDSGNGGGSIGGSGAAWQVDKRVVRSPRGVVAAQHGAAAEIGAEVLRAGGNALDAAIATSLALGVVEPWMSGLGGCGAMLLWRAAEGRAQAVDLGLVAPRRLDPSTYPLAAGRGGDLFGWPAVAGDRNLHGPLSVAVPSLGPGLGLAHERFGTMPLAELAAPAVALAERGLEIDWSASQVIAAAARELRLYPGSAERWLPDGLPPVPAWTGDRVVLPLGPLADTLRLLAEEGWASCRTGGVAERLLADFAALDVPIDAADLEGHAPRLAQPLRVRYRGADLALMPGPFAGAAFARALALLEPIRIEPGLPSPDAYAAYMAALLQVYAERLDEATNGETPAAPSCTTHLCVVDRHGDVVSLTQTLLSSFGSKLTGPASGLMLNNGVMWFDPRPGRANSMAPGKRPLANMCPVIGRRGHEAVWALGASGGRRILPAVLQLASFLIDGRLNLEEAFRQPRLDVSGTDLVTQDSRLRFSLAELAPAGVALRRRDPQPSPLLFACPTGVWRDVQDGLSHGMTEVHHPLAAAAAEV